MRTLLFCTSPFVAMAEAVLKAIGDPGVHVIEVDHPLGDLDEEEVVDRAEAVLGAVDRAIGLDRPAQSY